jgi:hypothetical protein
MYRRRILCTLYGAVDFFIVPYKVLNGRGGGGGGGYRSLNYVTPGRETTEKKIFCKVSTMFFVEL